MLYTTIFWICFSLWIYALSVLKRAKLAGFYFIVGSIGLFATCIFLFQDYLVWLFSAVLCRSLRPIGLFTGLFSTVNDNLLILKRPLETLYVYLDFECSGVIETTAFFGLIMFYPLYTRKERSFLALTGIAYIYFANFFRILLIVGVLQLGGSTWFYFVHSILGRLFFYVLIITLYYNVFTRSHIVQKYLQRLEPGATLA